jgi:hypothetical protein
LLEEISEIISFEPFIHFIDSNSQINVINWLTYKYSRDSRPSNESLRNSVRRFSLRILEEGRLHLDQNSSKRWRVSSGERYGEMSTVIFCCLECKLAPLFEGQLKFPIYNSLHLNHRIPKPLLYRNTCPCSQVQQENLTCSKKNKELWNQPWCVHTMEY